MIRLYRFVESCLPESNRTVTYESMDDDTPDNVGIFLFPAEEDEVCLDGTQWENIKVQVQVTSNSSEDDISKVSSYLRSFINNIESNFSCGDGLEIINVSAIRKMPQKFHTNNQMISKWESEVKIKYILEE